MQPTAFTCDRCQAPLPPGVSVCPNCGQTFAAPVPSAPSAGYVTPGQPQKKGLPTIGIVGIVGCVGCFPVLILAAILFPVFAKVREKARETSSTSNLRMIGLATLQYEEDHNQKFPPTDTMDDFKTALSPYMKTSNTDYFTETGYGAPYALNPALSNKDVSSVGNPVNVVLAHETIPHDGKWTAVLYADGHVRLSSPSSDDSNTDTAPTSN